MRGSVCAILFRVLSGPAFGITPADAVIKYVFPIRGGGNGAGAVPMSKLYEQITGDSAVNYYAFAIIILTIANVMSIIAGCRLNCLGELKPDLTGDRKTLLRANSLDVSDEKEIIPIFTDMCGAILPKIAGAPIHEYAYMIIFAVVLAVAGVIPASIRAGARLLQKFMNASCAVVVLTAGLDFDFDLAELAQACTFSNVIIAFFVFSFLK